MKKNILRSLALFGAIALFNLPFFHLNAQNLGCWDQIKVGVDFLYWTPCVGDNHFAVVENTESDDVLFETRYINHKWDPGVRAYVHIDNLWNGFNGGVVYTHFKSKAQGEAIGEEPGTVKLSHALPELFGDVVGDAAIAVRNLDYQTVDAYLSYPLNISCDPRLTVSAFSGVKWVQYKMERGDALFNLVSIEASDSVTFARRIDVCGIGALFGCWTEYKLSDCIKAFSMIETSLIVATSKNEDYLLEIDLFEEGIINNRSYKSKDDCFCFGGLHVMTGLVYETCYCDTKMNLSIGWEYVQWVNAPTFPYYEEGGEGVRSASSEQNLTMQGLFAGLSFEF